MDKGTLYLVPVTLGSEGFRHVIPEEVINKTIKLRIFIVEEIRTARRYLRLIDKNFPIDGCQFLVVNEHTPPDGIASLLGPLFEGKDIGLMSEAGLPCIADPGALVVKYAHTKGVTVVPLSGPSSIILALISSGFNGQNFTFNGYLPIKPAEREQKVKELEQLSRKGVSQIFMETPYRNQQMLDTVLRVCRDETLLCVAMDITLPSESISTKTVAQWKKNIPQIKDRYAVFVV